MKKLFLIFSAVLIIVHPSCAYTEDIILQKCMKDGNYTSAAMMQCCYDRAEYYQKLCQKLTANLKDKLSEKDYEKLVNNQNLLENYATSLNAGAVDILHSVLGTIHYTIASGIQYDVYRENYWILCMIDTNIICKNKLENKIDISKADKEIDVELRKLKNHLTAVQYANVVKSQQAWQIYFDSTKNNVLPIFKSQPEIQNYIIRMLYESRISILRDINAPFEY